MPKRSVPWPHAPTHQLSQRGTYFLTASTYLKAHHFRSRDRLRVLHRGLLTVANTFGWRLEAWAVFSNHYHFVGHSLPGCVSLADWIDGLHRRTSTHMNELDQAPGRRVWFNYWDTELTFERS